MVRRSAILRVCVLAACLVFHLPDAFAQGGSPTFINRNLPDVKATPIFWPQPSEPIPPDWLVASGIVVIIVGGVLLYFASRAWRAANIFERKYRFPPSPEDPAVRFGGNRSGGLMATIEPAEKKKNA
jgi:hypothetical protein